MNRSIDFGGPDIGGADLAVDQYETFKLAGAATFCIRLMARYAGLCERDFTSAAVFLSVALAGTQHLRNRSFESRDFQGRYYRDGERRAVSISSIARSLDLPTETVRRKCLRLAALGLVDRTGEGKVIVTSRTLNRPDVEDAMQDGLKAMNILLDQVRRSRASPAP